MKNILIFRTDRLGDYIIHSRPIYELKKKITDCKIIIVCSILNSKILKNSDYIDEIIVYDKNFSFFKKINIFFKLFKMKYYGIFALDNKKFTLFCNIFLISKYKFGFAYKYQKKFLNYLFIYFKPNKIYRSLFFDKISYFSSRKYLNKTESLCQKYLDLFNFFKLDLTINDNYIFKTDLNTQKKFDELKLKFKINDYVLINFDEKWLDFINNNDELLNNIKILQRKIKKKIILTGYQNNFDYYNFLKNSVSNFDLISNKINIKENTDILLLDNLNINIFERFIKNSFMNISCHSGFVVQVSGANNAKIIDIIHEKDQDWYKCWVPSMITYNVALKSTIKSGPNDINDIFNRIYEILTN